MDAQTYRREESEQAATADTRLDVLFVLNSLGIGGSRRKVVRVTNQLCQRGVHAGIAVLNGPYTLKQALREEVPWWRLDRRGKFSPAAAVRLRALIKRQRPRTLIAVNLYPTLYVLLAAA